MAGAMTRELARFAAIVALSFWAIAAAPAETLPAVDSWQQDRLLAPSAAQRRQEQRGQVFIYDGLENGTVQRAMDRHFDRIQNMMFTRVRHLPPTGAGPAVVEDDGCD